MGFKIVLEETKTLVAGTVTQPATQAVDLGQYREVAVVYDITVAAGEVVLKLQTAIEPFDQAFVDVTGSTSTYASTEGGRRMLYVTEFARYLRWQKTGTGSTTLNRVELYAKEPA